MPYINGPAQYQPTGEYTGGMFNRRPKYVLTADLGYFTPKVPGVSVQCKAGFVTDLASIPTFFFLLHPDDCRWDDAAIIHDRACVMVRRGQLTYAKADNILYYAMLELGASKALALMFWTFVRGQHLALGWQES